MTDSVLPTTRRGIRRLTLLVTATLALVLAGIAVPQAAQAADHFVTTETELQTAANAAAAGDTIFIQNDLALTGPVTFPTGVIIQGSAPGIAISRANNAAYHLFLLAPTAVSQEFTVQDLEFDGTVGNGSAVVLVDGVSDVADATFTNVFVHHFTAGALSAVYVERLVSEFTVDGNSIFSNNESVTGNGGAIGGTFFNATVVIEDSSFSDNQAAGSGGAVYLLGDNAFTVTVDDTTFTDNRSVSLLGAGGALATFGQFTSAAMAGNQFQDNDAGGSGGGAYLSGILFDVTVEDTTFTENLASTGEGGGLWASAGQDLRIDDSDFDQNTSGTGGGGAFADGVTSFILNRDTFTDNTSGLGGGLRIGPSSGIDLEFITMSGNTGNVGGGIYAATMGRLSDSTFTDNDALNGGGAIFVFDQLFDFATARNTFRSNEVTGFGDGGAILIQNAVGTAAIRFYNSTFSDNEISAGQRGASIAVTTAVDDVYYQFLELTFNETLALGPVMFIGDVPVTATFELGRVTMLGLTGGLEMFNAAGATEIHDSILDGDLGDSGEPSLLAGTPVSTSWSIIDEALNGNYNDLGGNQFSVTDAQLGPLQNNGGATFTRLPQAGSSAIDMANPAPGAITSFDQRGAGFDRIVNGRLDIGAVEVQAVQLALSGSEFSWPALYLGLFGVFAGLALFGVSRRSAAR